MGCICAIFECYHRVASLQPDFSLIPVSIERVSLNAVGRPFSPRANSVKLKLFARRMSAGTPRMKVRRHVHWSVWLMIQSAVVLVVGGAVSWAWQGTRGDDQAARQSLQRDVAALQMAARQHAVELQRLKQQLSSTLEAKAQMQAQAQAANANMLVERVAAERLSAQMRTLETENARLKADLTYLESLLPAGNSDGPIAIRRFEVSPVPESRQLRYRALLTQDARADRDFDGAWQLSVRLESKAGKKVLVIPDDSEKSEVRVTFRRYQRIEGIFDVPVGMKVRSVQLRVLEGDTLRAQQTAML
jgi:hypothetical protein